MSKVFNIVFDEGHCISQWGSTFRPKYKLVGMLRFIAPGIPFYITSATIPHAMLQDIKVTLHIPSTSLLFQRSNDRHNIAFCVKKLQHPMSSFEDLAFLVPSCSAEHDHAPRKFMVFFDSRREAESASIFLRDRMPEALKHKVKWFHAGMTELFRKEELQLFREGSLWGLGMTDVGGMVQPICILCGCDISDTCAPFAGCRHSRCVDGRAVEGAQGPQHIDAAVWACGLRFLITSGCNLACRTEMVS